MFNTNKFMQTDLVAREIDVPVPDLKDWFDKDDKPVWKVRGLSGSEMAKSQESATKSKNILAVIESITGNAKKEKVEALKELLGTDDSVPVELAKRMEQLVMGSIEPEIDLSLAVKLSQHHPVTFMQITTEILKLTGLGSVDSVKLGHSTKSKK
jgi:hypothetical protein